MYSEFQQLNFDIVRYSFVWEDNQILNQALDFQVTDQALIITSGGKNVLSSALNPLEQIVAIDINPIQNELLKLQINLIKNYDYATFRGLLGLDGKDGVSKNLEKIQTIIKAEHRDFWNSFFERNPKGILHSGKLETYLTAFINTLPSELQQKLHTLVTIENLEEQASFFRKYLDKSDFRKQFINYFNESNLSKGRDSKLFKYAEENAGETFYNRLCYQADNFLFKNNLYFRFFFFGAEGIPTSVLPPCYQEKNFDLLKKNLHKIKIVTGEATDYLLSEEGKAITKASLSNIFEYTDKRTFEEICNKLSKHNTNLKFIYWNLLQNQIISENQDLHYQVIPKLPTSCFYFKNIHLVKIS
ncbi:MAG: BtaA family protein [Raineya sp.]|jgi:S-adenosylmethionine-diacylglycerol 3-amino-3-carboxypropyl transferase|nr:BtaA family protein [Raineya sp.]